MDPWLERESGRVVVSITGVLKAVIRVIRWLRGKK